jgi:outer membrane protein TolC
MEAGLASKLDVFRADLQVSVAQDAVVSASTALVSALEAFRVLLGLSPMDFVEPEPTTLDDSLALDLPPLPVLVARALRDRLDLRESEDQIADARRSASLARQDLLPQLDLNVRVSRFGFGPSYEDSLRAMDQRVDVFLSTSYPLERAADRARSATAQLRVAGANRSFRQRQLEVEAEVRAAVRDLERIMKSVELQKKNVDLASQQQRLATLRYQRGIATNFDVVEAEERLVTARAALVNLLSEFQIGRVRLLRTTGELDPVAEGAP